MTIVTPFSACADHLGLRNHELADLLNEHAEGHFTPHSARLIREGRMPLPAFAWSALRQAERQLDWHSEMALQLHEKAGGGRFNVTLEDMRNSQLRRVLVRAMLKLEGGAPVGFSRNADVQGESWGII